MRLNAAIDIYSGGPGSGCRGDNCGRHPGSGSEEDHTGLSEKAKLAIASFKPVTPEMLHKSKENEFELAKAIGGKAFKGNYPFDVIAKLAGKKIGIELKTRIGSDTHPRVNMDVNR